MIGSHRSGEVSNGVFNGVFNDASASNPMTYLTTLLVLFSSWVFAAQDFSSWRKFTRGELILETTALSPGSVGTAGLHISLTEPWHTYWVNAGDSGAGVRMTFHPSDGLKVKSVQMPLPKRFMTGPLVSFAYDYEALLPVELEVDAGVAPGRNLKLGLEAEWLVCAEVCIPASETFELTIPVRSLGDVRPGPQFPLFQKTRVHLPRHDMAPPKRTETENRVRLEFPEWKANEFEFTDFFPFRDAGLANANPSVVSEWPLILEFAKADGPAADNSKIGLLVSRSRSTGALQSWQFGDSGWSYNVGAPSAARKNQGLLWMLISAFLGGLILNLMPCVFPILSMKLLSVMKLAAAHPREVRAQNFAYVFGVLLSFILIALALSLFRSAGQMVGWGFQLQSPVFVSVLIWTFFLLTLNLLGFFEIGILDAGFGHKLTRFGGLSGSFFTGVLAVVVASPCTAPFMGVALGFGLAQPPIVLLAVFFCLGLGLGFPYLLFAVFPRFVTYMPKPGAWMNWVKRIMAIPLAFTVLWLLWLLFQVRGPEAVAWVTAGCFALALTLVPSRRLRGLAKAACALIVVGGLLHAYRKPVRVPSGEVETMDGPWRAFSPALLEELKGRNVFVNMTADWCLTCKVNERLVFSDRDVLDFLKIKKVVLVKGDWTTRNEEIARFLNRYERVGVPFYVLYSDEFPDGLVLPEVLTVSSFKEWVEKAFPEGARK
jgi:cytochrome c biogenesis protein CcdA